MEMQQRSQVYSPNPRGAGMAEAPRSWEGGMEQFISDFFRGNQPCSYLDFRFQPSELGENPFLLF